MLSPIRPASALPVQVRLALAVPLLVLAACGGATPAGEGGEAPASSPAAASGNGAPAARDWSQTVVATPEGGFRMGNPDAKVKLIEYASLTCGVCQRFHLEGADALKSGLVRSGRVSYEFRPFMLNAIDIAGTLIAKCEGPERFFTWADQFYRNHDAFVQPFTKVSDADIKTLNGLPQDQQVRRLAELGGLDAFVRTRGMPRARFDQCLGDAAAMQQLMDSQKFAMEKMQVSATPTFFINGRKVDGATSWDTLRPRLEAALS